KGSLSAPVSDWPSTPPPRLPRPRSGTAGARRLSPRLSLSCSPVSPSPRRLWLGTFSRTEPGQSTWTHAGSTPRHKTSRREPPETAQRVARQVFTMADGSQQKAGQHPPLVVGLRTCYSTNTPPHG